jgi:hypothetical protein
MPLTNTNSSWILHIPKFFPSPSRQEFKQMWDSHPTEYHPLVIYGKKVNENRYSQLFSYPDESSSLKAQQFYGYSGSSRPSIPCDSTKEKDKLIMHLCDIAENLVGKLAEEGLIAPQRPQFSNRIFNVCLMNWYRPEHHIGAHSDDERQNNLSVPIMSLSWGGPRRFLLRAKPKTIEAIASVKEFLLKDGDLLIMGGKCQEEFKHEVPRLRKKDGLVTNRISWTIRSVELRPKDSGKGTNSTMKRKRES